MQSLEKRKAFRAEQRKLAEQNKTPEGATSAEQSQEANGNLQTDFIDDGTGQQQNQPGVTGQSNETSDDPLDTLTIAGLKDYVKSEGGEVPSSITKLEEIRTYAKNFREAKASGAVSGNGSGWGN